ncbi:DUF4179 domain-containing protein [Peribacillus sp. NPDC056705]|uniref:DUF4179 domain-containing protein n=1 Tax=Peribacillus sp. NPDC056705 TaxID=3345918 RepID=UPI0037493E95
MKNSFDTKGSRPEFPRDEVWTAISRGIQLAEDQINLNKESLQEKRKSKRKPLVYTAAAAVVAFGILVGSSYISPALANGLSRLPIIGSVFSDSGILGLKQASDKGLTSAIGETQTVNGISVTLDEVLYDQTNITVGFTVESEEELSDDYFGAGMDFTINGEQPPNGFSGGYHEKVVSPTVRTGIVDFAVTEEMPEEFELGLVLRGENGEKWMFSTPIEVISELVRVPVNHKQQAEGIKLTVSELVLSPSGVGLSYEASEKGNLNDELGASYIDFRMTDENGKEITSHSGPVTGKRHKGIMVFNGQNKFDPVSEGVKELTITPYLALPTDGGGVEFDENGESIELEFKGDSLQPVEFESFKVKIPQ